MQWGSRCGDTALTVTGRCSGPAWRGHCHRDTCRGTGRSRALPAPLPRVGTDTPVAPRSLQLDQTRWVQQRFIAGGLWEGTACRSPPAGCFPAPGMGQEHGAFGGASPIPACVRQMGHMSLPPMVREGASTQGCPGTRGRADPGAGFPAQSELPEGASSCPSTETLALVAPHSPGSSGRALCPCGPVGRGTLPFLAPLRCHPLSPGSRSLCGRRSCVIPGPRRRSRVSACPWAVCPPPRRHLRPLQCRGHRCGGAWGS